jgi:hypothetical protein
MVPFVMDRCENVIVTCLDSRFEEQKYIPPYVFLGPKSPKLYCGVLVL